MCVCVCVCVPVLTHPLQSPCGPVRWNRRGTALAFSLRQVIFGRSTSHHSSARAEIIINCSSSLNPDFFLSCSKHWQPVHFIFCLAWGAVSIGWGAKCPFAVAELIKCRACPGQVLTEAWALSASRVAWLQPSAGRGGEGSWDWPTLVTLTHTVLYD